jgi:hypothetical protein
MLESMLEISMFLWFLLVFLISTLAQASMTWNSLEKYQEGELILAIVLYLFPLVKIDPIQMLMQMLSTPLLVTLPRDLELTFLVTEMCYLSLLQGVL